MQWRAGRCWEPLRASYARGETLAFRQEDLRINGHALELRVYAEDPMNSFLPSVGKLEVYQKPSGENIRLDDGFEEGMEIPIYYDPMIAKLCTFGITREAAIRKMLEAIAMYRIEGVATTLPFGKFVCQHPAFTSGNFDTHFVPRYYRPELLAQGSPGEAEVAARLGLQLYKAGQAKLQVPHAGGSAWSDRR